MFRFNDVNRFKFSFYLFIFWHFFKNYCYYFIFNYSSNIIYVYIFISLHVIKVYLSKKFWDFLEPISGTVSRYFGSLHKIFVYSSTTKVSVRILPLVTCNLCATIADPLFIIFFDRKCLRFNRANIQFISGASFVPGLQLLWSVVAPIS